LEKACEKTVSSGFKQPQHMTVHPFTFGGYVISKLLSADKNPDEPTRAP
jgi:hypothetical protein